MEAQEPNRLIAEKSPYLLQHARNPVHWYPWSDEAFKEAKEEDKPIFLSIGYSTCHWCHVMERESFEDPEVARLMNDVFVSIKVDREERPDLDHIYMTVCQMLTGSGGWPLTIVMTPDKKPFFAATYLPKRTRYGRAGMMEFIPRIKEIWATRRNEVLESTVKILGALQSMENDEPGTALDKSVFQKAFQELSERYDHVHGGFSNAPKFPTPHNFFFMLRYWKRSGDRKALDMVEKTLHAMRQGGIYDHVGFGFHRYATDRQWLVPHFEKMLYDQAMLSLAYLEAFQATGKHLFENTAREIFSYVQRVMTDSAGGFYSAEDADSESVEGRFYLWKENEIRQVLPSKEADLVIRVFNVKKGGNFTEEATGKITGENILHLRKSVPELATLMQQSLEKLESRLASARKTLFEAREKIVHPHKDDKILTDWNGLMIAAFARGARVLDDPIYAGAAEKSTAFILKNLRVPNGRLLHRYREGEAGIAAQIDDYAFFIWGLIELYQATFETGYLKTAIELNEDMLKHFWDETGGGLFFTPDDGEPLIVRKKEVYDGAIPSGNAVAMHNLLCLARLTGRSDLEEKAAQIDRAFSEQIRQLPSGYTQFLTSADFGIGPSYEVVIVGKPGQKDTAKMLEALNTPFIPNKVTIFRASDEEAPTIDAFAEFVKHHKPLDGKATAYVCLANACKEPTTDVQKMMALLK